MDREDEKAHGGGKKYFTVEQANRTLPLVRSIVRDLVKQFQDLNLMQERLLVIQRRGEESSGPYREETDSVAEQLQNDAERLQGLLDELHDLGVEFKDFTSGLVDFPTIIDGREALLCWKRGEPQVAFWHELEAGYRGRQAVTEDLAAGIEEGVAGQ